MQHQKIRTTLKNVCCYLLTNPHRRKQCLLAVLLIWVVLAVPISLHRSPSPVLPVFPSLPHEPSLFDPFDFPDALKPQVEFWKKIFTEYTTTQVVIHDNWYVAVIYEVIDLGSAEFATETEGWKAVNAAKEKYQQILEKMAQKWETPEKMTETEQQIYAFFEHLPEAPRFKKKDANDRVRSQVGQADRVKEGIIRAGQYLAMMKQILAEYDLPQNLAYLPLIESAFNPSARSHLGAAGMWQFMRDTGQHYKLTINYMMDERRDPLKSTHAAAQLLAYNYKALQSWPLAVTAYNHGLQGLKNAMKQVGSANIAAIIEHYDGDRFGFASRNFYPEFLAAIDIGQRYTEYFGEIEINDPVAITQVTLPDYVAVKTLEKYSSLTTAEIRNLNPALNPSMFTSENFLPKGYQVNVLLTQKNAFETGYASIPESLKYQFLPFKAKYTIKQGDTLAVIARKYQTTPKAIMQLNHITNPRTIRAGQTIKIPGGYVSMAQRNNETPAPPEAAVPPVTPESSTPAGTTHRVEKGDTLFTIAKQYHTSPEALAKLNGIKEPRTIQPGHILLIARAETDEAQPQQAAPPSPHQESSSQVTTEHRVEKGQTLVVIARKYNTSVKAIVELNDIKNPRRIKAGQVLKIPEG